MRLTIMRGLPASGKTTAAREIVRKSGNTVRINRDDLRAMCFNGKWSGAREKFIIAAEKVLAGLAADMNYNAVIDDTNLKGTMWEDWARNNGVLAIKHDLTDVPIQDCIERDHGREKSVGPGVIYRLAAQGGILGLTGAPIVICDIDGTIADLTHRLHFIRQEPKDHKAFLANVHDDAPITEVIEEMRRLAEAGHDIVLVSGRSDSCSAATCGWLAEYDVPYVALLMRRSGDHRPDDQVKEELLALLPKERIVQVWDDRPSVIKMWKSHGLNVVEVNTEKWAGLDEN